MIFITLVGMCAIFWSGIHFITQTQFGWFAIVSVLALGGWTYFMTWAMDDWEHGPRQKALRNKERGLLAEYEFKKGRKKYEQELEDERTT